MSWNSSSSSSSGAHRQNSGDHKEIGHPLLGHNHTEHNHSSSYSPSHNNAANPYSSKLSPQHQVSPAVDSTTKDTFLVFLTLAFISVTLYITFFLWKKHREKPLATLYKLEEYRYSRLSQNEMDVDNVVFCGDSFEGADASQNSDDDNDECKPATLEIETDSLISLSNGKSNLTVQSTTTGKSSNNAVSNGDVLSTVPNLESSSVIMTPTSNLLQDSDEDLLQ